MRFNLILLVLLVLLSGCQNSQLVSHVVSSGDAARGREVCLTTPDERLRFAFAEMDARRTIFVRYDGDPERVITFEPGDPAYAEQIELAQGLKPGERKRQYSPRGDFLNSYNGYYRLKEDGSYEIVQRISFGPGVNELAFRTIVPQDPIYPCVSKVLQPSGAPPVYEEHRFFNFLGERIDTCLKARDASRPDLE